VNCLDPWAGTAVGGLSYTADSPAPGQARIQIVCAPAQTASVPAGTEIFLARLAVLHTKTVGTGSCAGCLDGACLGITSVRLTQPVGVGDVLMLDPLPGTRSDMVGWQMTGAVMPYIEGINPHSGEPEKAFGSCTSVTDAARPTWGAVKRLYR
jgi:hypothetical protein